MTKKMKMMIFGAGVALLIVALIVVLVLSLGAKGNNPAKGSSAGAISGEHVGSGDENGSDVDSNGNVDSGESDTLSKSDHNSAVVQSNTATNSKSSQANSTGKTPDASAATSSKTENNSKTYSILADPTFENGFNVLGMNVSDGGSQGKHVLNPLDSGGRQYWNLAQWGSRYSFADPAHTTLKKLGNNVFNYVNTTKEFGIDYNQNMLTFTGITSKCYDAPRTGGDWHHLLIEQSFKTADTKISDLTKVQVTMSNRLTYFKDNMGSAFNPGLHAAQYLMYFMVANNDRDSKDYANFIWFGFPLFDNRMEWNPPSSMLDRGTNKLMVGIGNEVLYKANNKNNCWKNGKVNASPNAEWSYFSIDVLPMIKNALTTAQKDGYMKNTSLDQLYITGMNLGWEIPGSYDVTMQMKDFSIMGTRK